MSQPPLTAPVAPSGYRSWAKKCHVPFGSEPSKTDSAAPAPAFGGGALKGSRRWWAQRHQPRPGCLSDRGDTFDAGRHAAFRKQLAAREQGLQAVLTPLTPFHEEGSALLPLPPAQLHGFLPGLSARGHCWRGHCWRGHCWRGHRGQPRSPERQQGHSARNRDGSVAGDAGESIVVHEFLLDDRKRGICPDQWDNLPVRSHRTTRRSDARCRSTPRHNRRSRNRGCRRILAGKTSRRRG
jgi:hypothetical protein